MSEQARASSLLSMSMCVCRRSRQVTRRVQLAMALFLFACAARLLLHKAVNPRRLLVVATCALGCALDLWAARVLMDNTWCPPVP
jgi:hypothetical protein